MMGKGKRLFDVTDVESGTENSNVAGGRNG